MGRLAVKGLSKITQIWRDHTFSQRHEATKRVGWTNFQKVRVSNIGEGAGGRGWNLLSNKFYIFLEGTKSSFT